MDPMTLLDAGRTIDQAMTSAQPEAPVMSARPRAVRVRIWLASSVASAADALRRLATRIEPCLADVSPATHHGR